MFSFKNNLFAITIIVFSICGSSYAPINEVDKPKIHSMNYFSVIK